MRVALQVADLTFANNILIFVRELKNLSFHSIILQIILSASALIIVACLSWMRHILVLLLATQRFETKLIPSSS